MTRHPPYTDTTPDMHADHTWRTYGRARRPRSGVPMQQILIEIAVQVLGAALIALVTELVRRAVKAPVVAGA